MIDIKKQNSILVLATCAMYLGLVLVGGAPQVLAQAALAKSFDIGEEIEKRDDLDSKPPETLNDSVQVYLEDIEYFLGRLQNLSSAQKFDGNQTRFEIAQATLLPCTMSNKAGSYTAEKFSTTNEFLRPALERFSKLLTDGYSLQDCLPTDRFPGVEATSSRFETRFDGKEFFVQVAVKKSSAERASQLAANLRTTFDLFRSRGVTVLRSKVLDSTSTHAKNDQVFVVTRLPRAGLDSLLALNVK